MQMSCETRVANLYHRVGAWRPRKSYTAVTGVLVDDDADAAIRGLSQVDRLGKIQHDARELLADLGR